MSSGQRNRRIVVDGQVYHWQVRGGPAETCCPYCPDESVPITLMVFHDRCLLFTRSLDDLRAVTPSVVCEQVREFVTTTGFVPAPSAPVTPQASETRPQRRRPHQSRRP